MGGASGVRLPSASTTRLNRTLRVPPSKSRRRPPSLADSLPDTGAAAFDGAEGERAARLYDTESANLARYGYGIKGFMLSMVQTAIELTDGRIEGRQIARILDLGAEMLAHPVTLLPGVEQALDALEGRRLILITKGDLLDQERKLAASGLGDLFAAVEAGADTFDCVSPSRVARNAAVYSVHGRYNITGSRYRRDFAPIDAESRVPSESPTPGRPLLVSRKLRDTPAEAVISGRNFCTMKVVAPWWFSVSVMVPRLRTSGPTRKMPMPPMPSSGLRMMS